LLIVDGVKYKLYVPKDEGEFENLAKEHLCEIFGRNMLYFDIKPELRSKAGIGSKPDGIAILFDEPCVYIVEFELSKHPVHDHIIAQMSRFNKALKSSDTRLKIAEAIYNEISSDSYKKVFAESKVKTELFKFLTDLLSLKTKMSIIIDEVTEELKESVEGLPFETRLIEFKTFEREGVGIAVHAHLFEPLEKPPPPPPPGKPKTWDEIFKWVNVETRDLVTKLIKDIEEKFPGIEHMPRARYYYYFYKGRERT
jgi:hypothetical protein